MATTTIKTRRCKLFGGIVMNLSHGFVKWLMLRKQYHLVFWIDEIDKALAVLKVKEIVEQVTEY
jgi:hypothetical protein